VISDQHWLADLHAHPQATRRVGHHHGVTPGAHRRADRVHDRAQVVALVGVDAPEEREDAPAAGSLDRAQHSCVAGDADRREARQLADRHLDRRLAKAIGGGHPPGAEHHEHVVARHGGAVDDRRGSGVHQRPRILGH
jgi:hypothetical protein